MENEQYHPKHRKASQKWHHIAFWACLEHGKHLIHVTAVGLPAILAFEFFRPEWSHYVERHDIMAHIMQLPPF